MRKQDSQIYIDELLLNVLGEEFFHQKQVKVKYIPTISKKRKQSKTIDLEDVS